MSETRNARAWLDTPLGRCRLDASPDGLTGLVIGRAAGSPSGAPRTRANAAARAHLDAAKRALAEYFSGERKSFADLALAPEGTAFEKKVWRALARIPFGQTESYGALARRIGHPGAARAVGRANGRNPLWLVLPCHRVIGADGSLTGYGGGLARKRWLLAHEGAFHAARFTRA